MRRLALGLISCVALVQSIAAQHGEVMQPIPGAIVLTIQAATPELEKAGLKLDAYAVSLFEQPSSFIVIFSPIGAVPSERGSGSKPTFEVEVSKVDRRVIRANFAR